MYECSPELDQLNKAFIKTRLALVNPSMDCDAGKYRYLSLDALNEVIYAASLPNGLVHRQWIFTDENGLYRVMTRLDHADSGQWERASVVVEPEMNPSQLITDRDGNKKPINTAIQQMGGSTSYWKRYCLRAVFGLNGSEDDNDGATSNAPYNNEKRSVTTQKPAAPKLSSKFVEWISQEQSNRIKEAIGATTWIADELKRYMGVTYLNQIPASRFDEAMEFIASPHTIRVIK